MQNTTLNRRVQGYDGFRRVHKTVLQSVERLKQMARRARRLESVLVQVVYLAKQAGTDSRLTKMRWKDKNNLTVLKESKTQVLATFQTQAISLLLLGGTMQPCMVEKTEYFCKDTQLDGAGLQKFCAFCLDFKSLDVSQTIAKIDGFP